MKPSSAVKKGKAYERKIASWIANLLGIEWGTGKLITIAARGEPGADINLADWAQEAFPFAVECKKQKRYDFHAWIEQAKKNADGRDWLLFAERNHGSTIVIMDGEQWFVREKKHLERKRQSDENS